MNGGNNTSALVIRALHIIIYNFQWIASKKQIIWTYFAIIIIFCLPGGMLLYEKSMGRLTGVAKLQHALFNTLSRLLWATATAILIYMAHVVHPEGWVNRFLSHPCFQVLSRLSYSMYLVHVPLLLITTGGANVPFDKHSRVPIVSCRSITLLNIVFFSRNFRPGTTVGV